MNSAFSQYASDTSANHLLRNNYNQLLRSERMFLSPFTALFHVKQCSKSLIGLAIVALITTGCFGISEPEGWSAPVQDGSTIFAQLERGTISAGTLSAAGTFTEKWQFPTSSDKDDFQGLYATPVIVNGNMFIASHNGLVTAIEVRTGRPVWSEVTDIKSSVVATPLVDGLFVYVATEDGEIVVLDAENGVEVQRLLEREGRIWSSPIARGQNLYVGKLDGRELVALDKVDGSIQWSQGVGSAVSADLAFADDLIIAGSLDGYLRAFDSRPPGAERWSYSTTGWIVAAPLVSGAVIYGATLDGQVFSLDANTGAERWVRNEDGLEIRSQPILLDGVLVIADRDGQLRGFDPATGQLRWENSLPGTKLFADPLAFNGRVLYLTKDGELISVSPNNGSVASAFDKGG